MPHVPPRLHVATPTPTDIVLTRDFAAPRARVFAALTRPDLLVRWHGARGWNLVVCEVDLRPGGAWRFVSAGPDGQTMGQSGTYLEVTPPHRLVRTEAFDGADDEPAIVTTVLTERRGGTTVSTTVRYPSQAVRDAMVETPMATGVGQSYARLDAVLTADGVAPPDGRAAPP